MSINHRAVVAFVVYATCAIGLVSPAFAQTADEMVLPSSKNPSQRVWDNMNVNANEKTIEAARAQCDRFADMVADDELTLVHCAVFQEKLRSGQQPNGQCQSVEAGEITFDFLGGRNNSTSRNITKQTKRDDSALLCDLNDGVYAYWFMQESEESCNNVGIVIAEYTMVSDSESAKQYIEIDDCDLTVVSTLIPGFEYRVSPVALQNACGVRHVASGIHIKHEGSTGIVPFENCKTIRLEVQQ